MSELAKLTETLAQINAMLPTVMALGQTVAGVIASFKSDDPAEQQSAREAVAAFRAAAEKVRTEGQAWLDSHPPTT
jgi:hydroxyethylthiazole kinase-like sugar kinase family protein